MGLGGGLRSLSVAQVIGWCLESGSRIRAQLMVPVLVVALGWSVMVLVGAVGLFHLLLVEALRLICGCAGESVKILSSSYWVWVWLFHWLGEALEVVYSRPGDLGIV